MMRGIRLAIARWLAPDEFAKADRYDRFVVIAADAKWWLIGEFKPAAAAIDWLLWQDRNYWRPYTEQPAGGLWQSDISGFRDQLRAGLADRWDGHEGTRKVLSPPGIPENAS